MNNERTREMDLEKENAPEHLSEGDNQQKRKLKRRVTKPAYCENSWRRRGPKPMNTITNT